MLLYVIGICGQKSPDVYTIKWGELDHIWRKNKNNSFGCPWEGSYFYKLKLEAFPSHYVQKLVNPISFLAPEIILKNDQTLPTLLGQVQSMKSNRREYKKVVT